MFSAQLSVTSVHSMVNSQVYDKAYQFAIRIVNAYKHLCEEKKNLYYLNNCLEVEPQLVQILPKQMELSLKQILALKCQ